MGTNNQADAVRNFVIRKGHGDVFGVWQRGELVGAFPREEDAAAWIAKLRCASTMPEEQGALL